MSLNFSRKLDYALYLLDILKKSKDKPVSINEVAKKYKLPKAFMEKVALELKNSGLIRSIKGRGGGYILARRAGEVALGDVMKVFEKEEDCELCLYAAQCPARKMRSEINKEIKKVFQKTKI